MVKNTYIQTYGCSANQNNSEILAGLLNQEGHKLIDNPEQADFIILNTCAVKEKTESKIKRRIQDLYKKYPNKKMIITGCLAQTDSDKIRRLNSNSIILGTNNYTDINNIINPGLVQINISEKKEEKILIPKISQNNLISITQISEGCLSRCSFCKTKLAKGNLFSYPMNKILSSIEKDLKLGAKEIWLTSQGNENYGMEQGKNRLIELINEILSLPYDFKLRLGMMNPINLPNINELIQVYKNIKMYRFLHIPIQSASNKVLKDMKRGYKIEKVELIINKFREEFPNMTIATDIITGYPTEIQGDHEKNLAFIRIFKPDVLNLSKFSKHKNTPAENLKELPKKIINQRNTDIMRLHRQTANENKQKFKNKIINVFVNKKNMDFYESRDENYNIILIKSDKENFEKPKNSKFSKKDFDAISLGIKIPNPSTSKKIEVFGNGGYSKSSKDILGKNIKIRITNVGVHHMIGEIIDKCIINCDNF
ncbi:tRNA (N(6)-L-threonylcarbamoyladenosine(37)-C(2))-methylthiotransferase [Candidatus Pacearchaeota archaeon]|nr:tRNA (N(6)-L-threonylcarbamoyladenosine(37)-C(2))-methylthiotransferase [Candidatus Pacearchaeota archaeon]